MSTEEKKSFAVDELDCDVVQGLIEKLNNAKRAVDTHIAALAKARVNYDKYMERLATQNGVDSKEYLINFATKQLEPIAPPVSKALPVSTKPDDASEPPAVGRELNTDELPK